MEKGEKRRRKIGEVSTASSTCGISRFPLPTGGDLETRLQKVARPQVIATNNQSQTVKEMANRQVFTGDSYIFLSFYLFAIIVSIIVRFVGRGIHKNCWDMMSIITA